MNTGQEEASQETINNSQETVSCEVCTLLKAPMQIGICLECFDDWLRGRFTLTADQKQHISARLDAMLGNGGEVHMEQLGREDEAVEVRAQAQFQER